MVNFKADSISQRTLLTVDFPEVLGTDTFECSQYQLLEREENVNGFVKQDKNVHSGRKAYPLSRLLRLVFFAYYRGIIIVASVQVAISPRVVRQICSSWP